MMSIVQHQLLVGDRCSLVAEIGNAHNGSFARAIRLLDAAKKAGADAGKLQCYLPDELVQLRGDGPAPSQWGAQGWTMRRLYEKAATPHAWFPMLYRYADDIGLPLFSSVFGLSSLALLESLNNSLYKVARLDNRSEKLLDAVCSTGKPVLVSVGPNDAITDRLFRHGNITTLYCAENYPTDPKDVRLPGWMGRDPTMAHSARPFGISSHCMDPRLPIAAVARGAKMVEMHFQLDDEPSELEANISLTASQFRRMVEDVRAVEAMLA